MTQEKKIVTPARIDNADGSVEVLLRFPVMYGEERIEKVKFRRPKAKDVKGIDLAKMDTDGMIKLMSKCSGQFPQALEELDMLDFNFCGEVFEGFLETGAKTGKTE